MAPKDEGMKGFLPQDIEGTVWFIDAYTGFAENLLVKNDLLPIVCSNSHHGIANVYVRWDNDSRGWYDSGVFHLRSSRLSRCISLWDNATKIKTDDRHDSKLQPCIDHPIITTNYFSGGFGKISISNGDEADIAINTGSVTYGSGVSNMKMSLDDAVLVVGGNPEEQGITYEASAFSKKKKKKKAFSRLYESPRITIQQEDGSEPTVKGNQYFHHVGASVHANPNAVSRSMRTHTVKRTSRQDGVIPTLKGEVRRDKETITTLSNYEKELIARHRRKRDRKSRPKAKAYTLEDQKRRYFDRKNEWMDSMRKDKNEKQVRTYRDMGKRPEHPVDPIDEVLSDPSDVEMSNEVDTWVENNPMPDTTDLI
jgi:hypothetical protein